MNSKEALKELEIATNWSSDEDIDKDLYNLWGNVACRTIKKDLDRLEELEKAFDTLSKDDEKAKKLLSLEIEKNRKLKHYEDIEEELGIELEVLFSALKNGVYYLTSDGQLIHDYVWLEDDNVCTGQRSKLSLSFRTFSKVDTLLFADYGKTWAVNKKILQRMN